MNLSQKKCIPCQSETPPLKGNHLQEMYLQLGENKRNWNVIEEHHLEKTFSFKDFKEALDFTNKVGELAEQENHHPDILLSWGKVKITLFTHKINGLSESDFILAAKIGEL